MTKDSNPEPEQKEEVKLQDMSGLGTPVPKKDMMKELPKDHTYHDRLVAQAEAMGIQTFEGQTDEMLIFRISMGGSS